LRQHAWCPRHSQSVLVWGEPLGREPVPDVAYRSSVGTGVGIDMETDRKPAQPQQSGRTIGKPGKVPPIVSGCGCSVPSLQHAKV
jgi:hypothetical protein